MKASQIIAQLQALIPKYTNLFTDEIDVSSITYSGGTVTVTTDQAHGLKTSDMVNIMGATSDNTISSLTQVNGIAIGVTASPHDLTQGSSEATISGATQTDYNGTFDLVQPKPINIVSITTVGTTATIVTQLEHGFVVDANFYININNVSSSGYNGRFNIASVVDTKTFTITVKGTPPTPINNSGTCQIFLNDYTFAYEVDSATVTPATGTPLLNETKISQYNGRHQIERTAYNKFTYTITGTPTSPASGTIVLRKGVRVTGVAEEDKIESIYTKQSADELWAFVVLGDTFANKDRNVLGDETSEKIAPTDKRQKIIQNFSVYTVDPAKTTIAGREARDRASDLRVYLIKSLVNAYFDSGFNESDNYGVSFIGDDIAGYTNAYYIHKFDFQSTTELNREDMVQNEDTVAFRNFEINYERDADSYVKKQDTGELP